MYLSNHKGEQVVKSYWTIKFFTPILLIIIIILTSCVEKNTTKKSFLIHNERAFFEYKKTIIKNQVLLSIPPIIQFPELPRGCEVTSLPMLLRFAGVDIDKMTLAQEINKVPYQEEGFYGNPSEGFVGNMYTYNEQGLSVYNQPIE
jgi:uncharacterized protein YvpB